MTNCARCGKPWEGDKLFITCPACRIPDTPKRAKRGCTRYKSEGGSTNRRSAEQKENIRETKFGIDR